MPQLAPFMSWISMHETQEHAAFSAPKNEKSEKKKRFQNCNTQNWKGYM